MVKSLSGTLTWTETGLAEFDQTQLAIMNRLHHKAMLKDKIIWVLCMIMVTE